MRFIVKAIKIKATGKDTPDDEYDPEQLEEGALDEAKEHKASKKVGKKIAKDHLDMDKKYYVKMKRCGLEKSEDETWKEHADALVDHHLQNLPKNPHRAANAKTCIQGMGDHIHSCKEKNCPLCQKYYQRLKTRDYSKEKEE